MSDLKRRPRGIDFLGLKRASEGRAADLKTERSERGKKAILRAAEDFKTRVNLWAMTPQQLCYYKGACKYVGLQDQVERIEREQQRRKTG
jgi:hypothetical protein